MKFSAPRFMLSLVLFVSLMALAAIPLTVVHAGSFISKTYSSRTYKVFIPAGYQPGVAFPVVVMLHGCTQDPDQFATGTEMNTYAEQYNFIVVYPDQPTSAHSNKCWRWFDPAHQARGSGEPALIVGMVNQVKADYTVDNNRVYVAGLSAGAAMSVILAATYPDVFAAAGIGSGLEYKAATNETNAWSVMSSGGPDPVTQGNAAYTAMSSYARVVPVIVFHGTSDYTVQVVNGNQILSQWAQTNDRAADGADNNNIDDTPEATINGSVSGGRTYTQYVYNDTTTGQAVMEKYLVNSMGHAWSGGNSAGSYTDPQGPKASLLIWQFFVAHPLNGAAPTATPVPPTPTSTATTAGPTATPTATSVSSTATPTVPPPTATATPVSGGQLSFASLAAEDGFAGALAADSFSTTVHKAGDKGMYNTDTYRLILSFDTSALPDAATITGATLRICRSSLQGAVTDLKADIKTGALGTNSALAQTDYSAAATVSNVATLSVPTANDQCTTATLSASALSAINKTGTTQIRLKATTLADFAADALTLYGGESTLYAPTLVVTHN